jgi:hypothetical protein
MAFSFADLGFWKLALLTFLLEVAQFLLASHWPDVRSSHIGPRSAGAMRFIFAEEVALCIMLGAAIGTVGKMFKATPVPKAQIAAISAVAIALLVVFFYPWVVASAEIKR